MQEVCRICFVTLEEQNVELHRKWHENLRDLCISLITKLAETARKQVIPDGF